MQAHYIPSGTRFAQLRQDSCFVHDANIFGQQGVGHGPRSLTGKSDPCLQREIADWTSDLCHCYWERREQRKRTRKVRRKREREERTREREKEWREREALRV